MALKLSSTSTLKSIGAALLIVALMAGGSISAGSSASAQAPDAGTLALVGDDSNIHLYDVTSGVFTRLTDDAIPGRRVYSWPTWATDGTLAYFGTSLIDEPPYRLGIFIAPPGGTAEQVYDSANETFTYAYWSPGACPAGNCRDLAVLYTQPSGSLAVKRIRWAAVKGSPDFTATLDELAEGGPFYWDWSPDGQAMLWARFGTALELYDVVQDSVVQTFDEVQGLQRAVDWSPVDDRLLSTVSHGFNRSDLVVFDGTERVILAEELAGVIAFEWSPDGSRVAYADDMVGDLRVIDSISGAEPTLISSNVLAFFWSPDGSKLAYIALERQDEGINAKPIPGATTSAAQEDEIIARWVVYDVATGTDQRFDAFLPSRDMFYYLQFFDQFARSHRLWSPDSRYLVYGGFDPASGDSTIYLIDTTAPGVAGVELMAGGFGVFSW